MSHEPRRCACMTRSGAPCRGWAVRGSEPPACRVHAVPRERGAGSGEAAAKTRHASTEDAASFYARDPADVDIDQAIAGLIDKLRRLDGLIAEANGETRGAAAHAPPAHLVRLLELYAQASSRLARLLRDRQRLADETGDHLHDSLVAAYEELTARWGIEL